MSTALIDLSALYRWFCRFFHRCNLVCVKCGFREWHYFVFKPAFYYFISKREWYPSRSSHLFQLFPPPQRKSSEGFHISATFLLSFLFSSMIPSSQSWGTTMLVINFLIPFISLSPPPLPPLCFMSSTPGPPSLPSSLSSSRTICLLQSHQYSPSPADSR